MNLKAMLHISMAFLLLSASDEAWRDLVRQTRVDETQRTTAAANESQSSDLATSLCLHLMVPDLFQSVSASLKNEWLDSALVLLYDLNIMTIGGRIWCRYSVNHEWLTGTSNGTMALGSPGAMLCTLAGFFLTDDTVNVRPDGHREHDLRAWWACTLAPGRVSHSKSFWSQHSPLLEESQQGLEPWS